MSYTRVTRLTGMVENSRAHERLRYLYFLINRFLNKYPPECNYKKNTETIIAYRQSILECTQNIEEVECIIACGSMEQLIVQAERELNLAKKLLPFRPWEELISNPPEYQWTWPCTPE